MKILCANLLTVMLLLGFSQGSRTQDLSAIIRGMVEKTHAIKTITYTSHSEERFNGETRKFSSSMVLNRKPFRLYYRQHFPNDGLEILFREDRDKGNAWVNPNGFPYITLHLNINGTHLRKNRHHSIYEADLAFIADLLAHLYEKHKSKEGVNFQLIGSREFDGQACWVLLQKNTDYKIISYKINQSISPLDLSQKLKINLFKILELNPKLEYDQKMSPGQCIQIPTDYGSEMEVWIDKKREIPLKIKVIDEKGLFEKYEFSKVRIDPVLSPDTYRPGNPNYRF
jgi:outer membrane lipoprotein-sorting protein